MATIQERIQDVTLRNMREVNGEESLDSDKKIPKEIQFNNSLPRCMTELENFIHKSHNGCTRSGMFEAKQKRFCELIEQMKMTESSGGSLLPFLKQFVAELESAEITFRDLSEDALSLQAQATKTKERIKQLVQIVSAPLA